MFVLKHVNYFKEGPNNTGNKNESANHTVFTNREGGDEEGGG